MKTTLCLCILAAALAVSQARDFGKVGVAVAGATKPALETPAASNKWPQGYFRVTHLVPHLEGIDVRTDATIAVEFVEYRVVSAYTNMPVRDQDWLVTILPTGFINPKLASVNMNFKENATYTLVVSGTKDAVQAQFYEDKTEAPAKNHTLGRFINSLDATVHLCNDAEECMDIAPHEATDYFDWVAGETHDLWAHIGGGVYEFHLHGGDGDVYDFFICGEVGQVEGDFMVDINQSKSNVPFEH